MKPVAAKERSKEQFLCSRLLSKHTEPSGTTDRTEQSIRHFAVVNKKRCFQSRDQSTTIADIPLDPRRG